MSGQCLCLVNGCICSMSVSAQCPYLVNVRIWSMSVSGQCLYLVNVSVWSMFASGQCLYLVNVCVWSMCVSGQCLYLANVCIWSMCVSGQCPYLVNVCVWSMFVSGQCVYMVKTYMWFDECACVAHLNRWINTYIHKWIESFPFNRSQQVVAEGKTSETVTVISGVPQESVMWPLLFLMFIISRKTSDTRLFADDAIVYRQIHSVEDQVIL